MPKIVKNIAAHIKPWETMHPAEQELYVQRIRDERRRPLNAKSSPKKRTQTRKKAASSTTKLEQLLSKMKPSEAAEFLARISK